MRTLALWIPATAVAAVLLTFVATSSLGNLLWIEEYEQRPEALGLKGSVVMMLYDESGHVKDERRFDNLIVNTGIQGVAYLIAPHDGTVAPSAPFNYIALGSGSTAVSAEQTALVAEFSPGAGYARVQDTVAQFSASTNKLVLSATFPPDQATGNVRESGIFNAATGGDMLSRQTFAEIQKAAGDTLTVTWTISLTPS
jgi:hypothetical protein